jgi:hypothetical protein
MSIIVYIFTSYFLILSLQTDGVRMSWFGLPIVKSTAFRGWLSSVSNWITKSLFLVVKACLGAKWMLFPVCIECLTYLQTDCRVLYSRYAKYLKICYGQTLFLHPRDAHVYLWIFCEPRNSNCRMHYAEILLRHTAWRFGRPKLTLSYVQSSRTVNKRGY